MKLPQHLFAVLLMCCIFSVPSMADVDKARAALEGAGGLVLKVAQNVDDYEVTFPGSAEKLNDELLAHVKAIPNLKRLNIAGSKVTDAGLVNLSGLKNLTHLHLERTAITDEGLKHLTGLDQLEYLNIYGTNVTDAGLQALGKMKGLKRLYIWKTKITEEAARKLEEKNKSLKTFGIIERPLPKAVPLEEPKPQQADKKEEPKTTEVAYINSKCPVSGKDVDPAKLADYKGQKVALCCGNCLGKFKENPEQFASKIVADLVKKPEPQVTHVNSKCPVSGKDVDPTKIFAYKDQKIAFCCGNCLSNFQKEPEKYIEKLKADLVKK